ncbi:MAG: cyanophycin synthetase, partial [Armatimonadota bacterium]|nr:cyanophycin synthetase [Armatimonadota bacterium]
AGLEATRVPAMRMRVARAGGVTLLDDAYNASPQSMAAALEHLRHLPGRRYGAVLGDMLELGAESEAAHHNVGRAAAWLDWLVTVGERARAFAAGAREGGLSSERIVCCKNAEEALAVVRDLVQAGDVVLVKASRAMGLEAVVQGVENA